MSYYLVQAGYTSEAWKSLVDHPEDRAKKIRPVIEKLGGTLEGAWFSFGDYDIVLVIQMPDNVSAASFAMAGAAGGALRSIKTTPLMALSEGAEAVKRAAQSGYRPPGK
jgi:uncharacterized protein with GYD domain